MTLAFPWTPSVQNGVAIYELRTCRLIRLKCEKIGCHDEIEKLALLDFVMATQASDFCFRFY